MNPIARFEAVCARVVEGTFARIFKSALDPAHVGRKLLAVQAATPTDTYLVRVHPVDYALFAPDRSFLEARWSATLREGARPGIDPRAVLHEDPGVVAGAFEIDALLDESDRVLLLVRPDGAVLELRAGLRIGRGEENDVVLRDGRVSRTHARIDAEPGGFAIADAGSSNGTFVDGVRVERARLAAGMRIGLGETILEIR